MNADMILRQIEQAANSILNQFRLVDWTGIAAESVMTVKMIGPTNLAFGGFAFCVLFLFYSWMRDANGY